MPCGAEYGSNLLEWPNEATEAARLGVSRNLLVGDLVTLQP